MFRMQRHLLCFATRPHFKAISRSSVPLFSNIFWSMHRNDHLHIAKHLCSTPRRALKKSSGTNRSPSMVDDGRYKFGTIPNALCVGSRSYRRCAFYGLMHAICFIMVIVISTDIYKAARGIPVRITKLSYLDNLTCTFQLCRLLVFDETEYMIAQCYSPLRIVATPIAGYLVLQHEFPIALGLFVVAGLTDMLDGFIARNMPGQKSLFGSVLDPIADKLLVSVMFVSLSIAALIPWPLTALVLTRDLCLIVGGFYKRYRNLTPPYSLKRFFNPEVSSMQVVPTLVGKANTVLQLSVIAASLCVPVFSLGVMGTSLATGLCWVTAFTTICSGFQYASGSALKKI